MVWIDDGSGFTSASGSVVRCSNATPGTPCAALGKNTDDSGITTGVHCWEFELLEGDAFFGLTTEAKFKPGWSCRGLFYHGNVSDGAGLLTPSFGPMLTVGSRVQLVVSLGSTLDIAVIHDGRRLGVAFSIPMPYAKPLWPVVSFMSPSSCVKVTKLDDIPENHQTREAEVVPVVGIEGKWKSVESAIIGDEEIGVILFIVVDDDGGCLRINAKCINTMNFEIAMKKGDDGGVEACYPGGATRMLGPPLAEAFEKRFQNLLTESRSILVSGSGNLSITGDDDSLVFNRYADAPPPCTKNVFQ